MVRWMRWEALAPAVLLLAFGFLGGDALAWGSGEYPEGGNALQASFGLLDQTLGVGYRNGAFQFGLEGAISRSTSSFDDEVYYDSGQWELGGQVRYYPRFSLGVAGYEDWATAAPDTSPGTENGALPPPGGERVTASDLNFYSDSENGVLPGGKKGRYAMTRGAVPYFYLSAGFHRPLGETASFDAGRYFEGGIGKDLYLGKKWGLGVSAGLRCEQEFDDLWTSQTWGLAIGLSISTEIPVH